MWKFYGKNDWFLNNNKEYSVIGLTDTEWISKDGDYIHRGDFNSLLDDVNFDLNLWNDCSKIFINKQNEEIKTSIGPENFIGSNYMFTKDTWEKFGKFRISFYKPWVAVDHYLYEDLIKNNIKFGRYMKSLIYHPTGGQGTSKYVYPNIEEWRLNYLKNMNANII